MADSEDVIELGSSDDEPGPPAPKKPKHPVNAMVSIPRNISGVNMKPLNVPPVRKKANQNFAVGKEIRIVNKTSMQALANGRKMLPNPVSITPNTTNLSTFKNSVKLPASAGLTNKVVNLPKDIKVSKIRPKIGNTFNFPKQGNVAVPRMVQIPKPSGQVLNPFSNAMSPVRFPQTTQKIPNFKAIRPTQLPPINEVMDKVNKHFFKPCLSSLPPGITVKRTKGQDQSLGVKRSAPMLATVSKKPKKSQDQLGLNVGDVLTVELDDDDAPQSPNDGPQWYVRPEPSIENVSKTASASKDILITNTDCFGANNIVNVKENEALPIKALSANQVLDISFEPDVPISTNATETNAFGKNEKDDDVRVNNEIGNVEANDNESEPTKFIEIIIEDSPVKPLLNRKPSQLSSDFAIEIEDSPVKTTNEEVKKLPKIREEDDGESKVITPKSKKKLSYPGDISENVECSNSTRLPETNIELDTSTEVNKAISKEAVIATTMSSPIPSTSKPSGEFSDIYQSFIDMCLKLEDSDDMRKIVEKKVKNYYRQTDKSYTESEEFIELVSSKVCAMKVNPDNLYLYIKDVVDELNMQRKMAKTRVLETVAAATDTPVDDEDQESNPKQNKNVRKLEKTLRKLHRAIQKLEEQEVDFDDDADSVYLLTESEDELSPKDDIKAERDRETLLKRYKERLVKVHAKLCQLTGSKMPSEAKIRLEVRPGRPQGPVRRLEKYINKKVPMGAPLPFPDFHDVLRCVREANMEDNVGWSEMEIQDEARDLFARCGKKLQKRRQENEWRLAVSRIQSEVDPADVDPMLKKKLEENKKVATKKETDVINKYVEKQNQLKLEAKEITEKEAEESSANEDDDCQEVEEPKIKTPEKSVNSLVLEIADIPEEANCEGAKKEKLIEISPDIIMSDIKVNEKNGEKKTTLQSTPRETDNSKSKEITKDDNNAEDCIQKKDDTIGIETEDSLKSNKTSEKSDSECGKIVISGDSSSQRLGTDIDELHLLKTVKGSSNLLLTIDSSDTDARTGTSDNNESSQGEQVTIPSSEVVSIENSTYSEDSDSTLKNTRCVLEFEDTESEDTIKANEINESINLESTEDDSSNAQADEAEGIQNNEGPDRIDATENEGKNLIQECEDKDIPINEDGSGTSNQKDDILRFNQLDSIDSSSKKSYSSNNSTHDGDNENSQESCENDVITERRGDDNENSETQTDYERDGAVERSPDEELANIPESVDAGN